MHRAGLALRCPPPAARPAALSVSSPPPRLRGAGAAPAPSPVPAPAALSVSSPPPRLRGAAAAPAPSPVPARAEHRMTLTEACELVPRAVRVTRGESVAFEVAGAWRGGDG